MFLINHQNYKPDIIVHLRPTYPFRNTDDISNMINILKSSSDLDSIRSVSIATSSPYKMWTVDKIGLLKPLIKVDGEFYNKPRQLLPKVFLQNGSIDVTRFDTIFTQKSMTGKNIKAYIMDENFDIDSAEDYERAKKKQL
jgi:CMP-N-acetylneuraminic acid synthetase